MSSFNIDSLNIEITENSSQAYSGLNKLTESLSKLKSQSTGFKNLEKLAKSIQLITDATSKLSGVGNLSAKISPIIDSFSAVNSMPSLRTTKLKRGVSVLAETIATLNTIPIPQTDSVTALVTALQPLETIGRTNLTGTLNSLQKLPSIVNSLSSVDTSSFKTVATSIVASLKPLEMLGKTNLAPVINQLKKLPELSKSLGKMDLELFATQINKVATTLKPLANEMEKVSRGFSALPSKIQRIITSNERLKNSNYKTQKSFGTLGSIISSRFGSAVISFFSMHKIMNSVSNWITNSNAYIENLNLFEVAMGDAAEEAFAFAQAANEALGVDVSEFIRFQGIFQSITSGFGALSETSNVISKNLTQLGYDLASFYNLEIEDAMLKLQSGLSGELEPLRRLGFALDQVTLQQKANELGVRKRLTAMEQSEKAELRYYTIMTQGKKAMNDMARTIMTPTNALRILSQQYEQLQRALGNLFIPMLIKIVPYVQAVVRVLTELAQKLAVSLGFELPTIDYSSVGNGLSNIVDTAEEANTTVKELKRTLSSIDQLNIIGTKDNSASAGAGISATGSSLGIDLPEYNFLDGLQKGTEEIYRKVKQFLTVDMPKWFKKVMPLIKTIGVLFAGWKISKMLAGVKDIVGFLKNTAIVKGAIALWSRFSGTFDALRLAGAGFFTSLKSGAKSAAAGLSPLTKAFIGVGGVVGAFALGKKGMKSFMDETKNTTEKVKDLTVSIGGTLGFGAVMGLVFGPAGVVVTALSFTAGAIYEVTERQQELYKKLLDKTFYDGVGVSLDLLRTRFDDLASKISESTSKTLELYKVYQENRKTANNAVADVQDLITEWKTLGIAVSKEVAPKIKSALEEMYVASQSSLRNGTTIIVNELKTALNDTANQFKGDVNSMISDMYLLQAKGNKEIAKLNERANALITSMIDLDPQSSQFRKLESELQGILKTFTDINQTVSKSELAFSVYSKNIDFSTINFESEDAFKAFLTDLEQRSSDAMKGVEEAQISALTTLQEQKNAYKALGLDRALGTERFNKLFDDSAKIIKQNYNSNKSKIDKELKAIMGAVQLSLNKKIEDIEISRRAAKKPRNKFEQFIYDTFGDYSSVYKNFEGVQSAIDKANDKLNITPNEELGKQLLAGLENGFEQSFPSVANKITGTINDFSLNNPLSIKSQYAEPTNSSVIKKKVNADFANPFKLSTLLKKPTNNPLIRGVTQGFFANMPVKIQTMLTDAPNKSSVKSFLDKYFKINPVKIGTKFTAPTKPPGMPDADWQKQLKLIRGYATGGFPESGEFFVARENGIPEMVGAFGGRTAVANNDQIVSGIKSGVYEAVVSAMSLQTESDGNIIVNIYQDGVKKDTQSVRKSQRTNGKYAFNSQ